MGFFDRDLLQQSGGYIPFDEETPEPPRPTPGAGGRGARGTRTQHMLARHLAPNVSEEYINELIRAGLRTDIYEGELLPAEQFGESVAGRTHMEDEAPVVSIPAEVGGRAGVTAHEYIHAALATGLGGPLGRWSQQGGLNPLTAPGVFQELAAGVLGHGRGLGTRYLLEAREAIPYAAQGAEPWRQALLDVTLPSFLAEPSPVRIPETATPLPPTVPTVEPRKREQQIKESARNVVRKIIQSQTPSRRAGTTRVSRTTGRTYRAF